MSGTIQTTNNLQGTLRRITETPEFKRGVAEINRGARVFSISGLVAGSARALALAALQRETRKRFAVVTQSNRDLEPWEGDLRFWYCALTGRKDCENEVLVLLSDEGRTRTSFSQSFRPVRAQYQKRKSPSHGSRSRFDCVTTANRFLVSRCSAARANALAE